MALECGSPGQGQGSPLVCSHWVQVSVLLLLSQITKTGWRALDWAVRSDAPHSSLCPLGAGSCGNGGRPDPAWPIPPPTSGEDGHTHRRNLGWAGPGSQETGQWLPGRLPHWPEPHMAERDWNSQTLSLELQDSRPRGQGVPFTDGETEVGVG